VHNKRFVHNGLLTVIQIYAFKNIRFAAPPVGNLRFAKPAPPIRNDTLQTGEYGGSCAQSVPKSLITGIIGEGLGTVVAGLASTMDLGKLMGGGPSSEDCLFLDLYVPAKALRGEVKLPIINWIYGGAYVLGTKDGLYEGTGIIRSAGGNAIFVAGNYRVCSTLLVDRVSAYNDSLGRLGLWAVQLWRKRERQMLVSMISEQSSNGFTIMHRYLVVTQTISVFGENQQEVRSPCAQILNLPLSFCSGGSIMHHLTAFGGKQPALFRKVVIQSAAYDVLFDRKGSLEESFQNLTAAAGCTGKGIACLRALSFTQMKAAQEKYMESLPPGKFGFGYVLLYFLDIKMLIVQTGHALMGHS
jgi:carboxylesterase type B